MLKRLAKLKEIQAKGAIPPRVDIEHHLPEPTRRRRYHHRTELNKLRAEREQELLRQAQLKQEELDYEVWKRTTIITAHARKCWKKLVESRAFRHNANHGWLHFERFIEDIGMPANEDQQLWKDPRHVSYTKFSIRWVGG